MSIEESAISIKNLGFSWLDGRPEVIDIPALDIELGESVFLHGPSGCGKSTLISLLAGVTLPSRGKINVLNETISSMNGARRDRFRADHVGLIFQMFNLVPYLSVVENVTLPCGFSQSRKAKITKTGMSPEQEAKRLLDSLDLADPKLQKASVADLSVGQQQRVAAARALIGSPELVIADEPTSALDNERAHSFVELLFAECRANNSTLLFISHDMTLARHFDRVVSFQEVNLSGVDV